MHKASEALAAGANFQLLGPNATMLQPRIPTVAVTAVRTGVGKSQTTRAVAATLKEAGKAVVAVRHPMPYGDLVAQRVQRFAELEDLDRHHCTIEEREEYEPHISSGTVIYAGVDYAEILEQAQAEGDVLLWDGGNNDLPFYVPTVHLALVDPLRVGHETRYHPGEANLRRADVIVINKIDSATKEQVASLESTIAELNPRATVVKANSKVSVDEPEAIRGKRVLVVEDGPTLTHGEMKIGAGVVAAERSGAAEIVDPRPWAIGSIAETFEKYDVGAVLPAMGYSQGQLDEMAKIIDASDADLVVIGTPIDLRKVVDISKPAVRVRYDLDVLPESPSCSTCSERCSRRAAPGRVAMEPRTLRVATWNVHGLRAGVTAVASAIRAEELDVVLVQESGPRRRLRDLARMLGWTLSADPRAFPRRRVQNALLARPGVVAGPIRPRHIRFARASLVHPRGR